MSILNEAKGQNELTVKARVRGTIYASLLMLFAIILFFTLLSLVDSQMFNDLDQMQHDELILMEREVEMRLHSVESDLTYFCQNILTRDFMFSKDSGEKNYLLSLLKLMATSADNRYDQIRVLDRHGMEKLRLNNIDDEILVVPDSQLQDKSGRYYVKEAFKLDSNQTYISAFDLNVENGDVETPRKPMIRYAQQIYNSDGSVIGVGILNFLGENLLNSLKRLNEHEGDKVYFINVDGHFLIGDDSLSEWGWMFPGKETPTFQMENPQVAKRMTEESGEVMTEKGKYYFTTVSTKSQNNYSSYGEDLYLVMHVPQEKIDLLKQKIHIPFRLVFFIITPLMLFLGFHLGNYQVRQHWLFHRLEEEATHDMLTGLYNRRAIMERLYNDIRLAWRRKAPLTVAFIDVNDLKIVNDMKGHDAGDMLIKGAADALSELIRETDYAARIGGDEFLIAFHDCSRDDAERIMERIQYLFNEQGKVAMNTPWTMSWGCASLRVEDSVEDLVVRADARMYDYKIALKTEKGETPR